MYLCCSGFRERHPRFDARRYEQKRFFVLDDLPPVVRQAGPARDALLLRVLGSPDPYGAQIDGLGGASSLYD